MLVAALLVYPLKGARGVALASAKVLAGGLEHDRRFMVVREDGSFVSQRQHPRLALVHALVNGDALAIGTSKRDRVQVPLSPSGPSCRVCTVRVWKDDVVATEILGEAPELLSDHLGERVRLVHMPDDVVRPVDPEYAQPGDRVGFADGFPVLVATLASLDELNARLPEPITMDRFRPNVVLAGSPAPHEEDRHARVRIGSVVFRTPKRCARCEVTTVDQGTAERGKEPLRTLATYRAEENKIFFAMNAIPDVEGVGRVLRLGDTAEFLDG